MSGKYDDIINMPHHISTRHKAMAAGDRAAQFSPFAALTGHSAAISETARQTSMQIELSEEEKSLLDQKLRQLADILKEMPYVNVTYFCPDDKKDGGSYLQHSGKLKDIKPIEQSLIFTDGQRIPIDSIICLDSELFSQLC